MSFTLRPHRRSPIQALLVLLCVLCSACGIMNEYAAILVSPSEANETTGLIILSVGASESCSAVTAVKIQKFDEPYNATPLAPLFVDRSLHESEFSDHYGHLYVVRLTPGKYYLTPHLPYPYGSHWYYPKADFELRAEEILYLGELSMPRSCGWTNPSMEFRDQEARDLPLLKATNPAFGRVNIAKRVLAFTGEAELSL